MLVIVAVAWTFFYYSDFEKIPRGLKLMLVVFFEITILYIFWNEIEDFITIKDRAEWLKGLLPILMAAVPAYLLWYWRDVDKKETLAQGRNDLKQKERDLEQKERDLKLKEDDAAWTTFIKYQKIAEDSKHEHSEGTRATAIFALGEYYGRNGTQFPNQIHVFFKKCLDDFWDKQKEYKEYLKLLKDMAFAQKMYGQTMNKKGTASYDSKKDPLIIVSHKLEEVKLPEYIKAVHNVINDKGKKVKNLFNRNDELCLNDKGYKQNEYY